MICARDRYSADRCKTWRPLLLLCSDGISTEELLSDPLIASCPEVDSRQEGADERFD
jgi:uncharacterized protein YegL